MRLLKLILLCTLLSIFRSNHLAIIKTSSQLNQLRHTHNLTKPSSPQLASSPSRSPCPSCDGRHETQLTSTACASAWPPTLRSDCACRSTAYTCTALSAEQLATRSSERAHDTLSTLRLWASRRDTSVQRVGPEIIKTTIDRCCHRQ